MRGARRFAAAKRGALLLVMVVSLASAGCGFRLRGTLVLPPVMEGTLLQGEQEGALAEEVRATLERAGSEVVTESAAATSILVLGRERFDRRVSGVDATGRATEYELLYSVTFALLDPERAVLVPEQSASLSRLYRFDAANVLGAGTEEEILRDEMRRFAVQQMLRQVRVQAQRNQAGDASPVEPLPPADGSPAPAVGALP